MPFYTRRMAKWLAKMEGKQMKESHKIQKKTASTLGNDGSVASGVSGKGSRSGTGSAVNLHGSASRTSQASGQESVVREASKASQVSAEAEALPEKDGKVDDFDARRIKMILDILKSEVERIKKTKGAEEWTEKASKKYNIQVSPILVKGEHMQLFRANLVSTPETQLVAKTYTWGEMYASKCQSLELKIIRHIGKKHPYIERTFDIFSQDQKIIILQDFGDRGSLDKYLTEKGTQQEQQVGKWAWQMANALDYLGNIGVAHRAIKPSHLLLSHRGLRIKLTGFHRSVLYFEPQTNEVINVSCVKLDSRPREVADFQAPEVYGDPELEEFDPLAADVWSFGSVLFHACTLKYPYQFNCTDEQFVGNLAHIEPAVEQTPLSQEGKQFIGSCLKLNVDERLTINKLFTNGWCRKHK